MAPEAPDPLQPRFRTIVEQERLTQTLSDLGFASLKLDDVIAGFVATVGRSPEKFARERHTGWSRVIVKAFPPDIPRTRIWFTFDDEHIYIEYVELLED